jgi:hypothetical protein
LLLVVIPLFAGVFGLFFWNFTLVLWLLFSNWICAKRIPWLLSWLNPRYLTLSGISCPCSRLASFRLDPHLLHRFQIISQFFVFLFEFVIHLIESLNLRLHFCLF